MKAKFSSKLTDAYSKFVINPQGKFQRKWDNVLIVCLVRRVGIYTHIHSVYIWALYMRSNPKFLRRIRTPQLFTAAATPYEVGFLESKLNALFVANRLVDREFRVLGHIRV